MNEATSPRATRGRPRFLTAEARRDRLLDAAETVFLTRGYHAASMDDVAHAASMSKKTIYQVFASKSEMFEVLLTNRFIPVVPVSADDGRPLAQTLTDILRHMAASCLAPRHIAMTRLMIAEAPLSREMADVLERLVGNGLLEECLTDQARQGRVASDRVREAANTLFFTAVGEALLFSLLGIRGEPGAGELNPRIDYAVRQFLSGATTGSAGMDPALPLVRSCT